MSIMKYDSGKGVLENWLVEESGFDERYLGKCEVKQEICLSQVHSISLMKMK